MKSTKLQLQSLTQKRGEVLFRQKIAEQHLGKKIHFVDEYSHQEMTAELKKRLISTKNDFQQLARKNISFSPFLEIGSEYCLRSMVLMKEYRAQGYALDISQASLLAAKQFAHEFAFSKMPVRICADAHKLPFPDNSFPFVFCYQTVHHFPNPFPVLAEIYRVLTPGGYFFCAEEPIQQSVNLQLFRRSTKSSVLKKWLQYLFLFPFISQIGKTEVSFGVVEETFSLAQWQEMFKNFQTTTATITPLIGKTQEFPIDISKKINVSWTVRLSLFIFGGGIAVLLQKPGPAKAPKLKSKYLCPECHTTIKINKPQNICHNCKSNYSMKAGVIQLLPKNLAKKLYGK